jgi:NAD-dependent SIR2 family protein deacetylase
MIALAESVNAAAAAIASAEALLIGAGAGMGVDSGLPDFRGTQGFWRAYPPYQKLGLDFVSLANPRWFASDPALAWGFYGHRLNLYRAARPHAGFEILLSWARRMPHSAFVFTSNVDGHFQRAGFDPACVAEVHGSVHWMQCVSHCGAGIYPADKYQVLIDETSMRAREPLPACPSCGHLARPNILMFGDWDWDNSRSAEQQDRLELWLQSVLGKRLIIVECGAGTAIPTVRRFCEEAATQAGTLIRINPREPAVPTGHVSLAIGALKALQAIDQRLAQTATTV